VDRPLCPGHDDSLAQDLEDLFEETLFLHDLQDKTLDLLRLEAVKPVEEAINHARVHAEAAGGRGERQKVKGKQSDWMRCFRMIEKQNGTDGEVVICLTTFPDSEKAGKTGTFWVESQLAACVSLLPGTESIYRWEGTTERSAEVLAIVKTTRGRLGDLEASLREVHPYQLPEFLVLSPESGSSDYLQWVRNGVTPY
jgi:periplasmic divalent cation tolerance protein